MFLHLSVNHSVHRKWGFCLSPCWDTPPWQVPPPGRYTPPHYILDSGSCDHGLGGGCPLGRCTRLAGTPPLLGRYTPTPGQVHHQAGTTHKQVHPPRQVHTLTGTPLPHNRHCSGRYASYWNAFLFFMQF